MRVSRAIAKAVVDPLLQRRALHTAEPQMHFHGVCRLEKPPQIRVSAELRTQKETLHPSLESLDRNPAPFPFVVRAGIHAVSAVVPEHEHFTGLY
jgi:hypothetical protein